MNSNQMEDQIGTVLHWSHQMEPGQAKSKDEVIRRNLDRIYISAMVDTCVVAVVESWKG